MKVTEDIRKYATEPALTDAEAIESGMQEKKKEFFENVLKFMRRHNSARLSSKRLFGLGRFCKGTGASNLGHRNG
jgi:hypothetical protein